MLSIFPLRWGLAKFLPNWPQTTTLLVSAFQVSRIADMSPQGPDVFLQLFCKLENFSKLKTDK
jgi:hypothetical protein